MKVLSRARVSSTTASSSRCSSVASRSNAHAMPRIRELEPGADDYIVKLCSPTGYKVMRRAPATEPNFRVLGSVSGTSFADTSAKPRTKYVYRVTAVNALGQSAQSDAAEIFYRPVGPGRVSGLSASADASGTSVSLSWSAPSSGSAPTGYQILRRAVASESSLVVLASVSGSASTSFVDSTASPGVRYVYRVRARNSVGLGQASLPAYAVVRKK